MKKHRITSAKTKNLIPYSNNARTHSDDQIAQIAASIDKFGFTNPILVDENNGVIAGHGRLIAANLLNMDTVPVVIIKNLSDAEKGAEQTGRNAYLMELDPKYCDGKNLLAIKLC